MPSYRLSCSRVSVLFLHVFAVEMHQSTRISSGFLPPTQNFYLKSTLLNFWCMQNRQIIYHLDYSDSKLKEVLSKTANQPKPRLLDVISRHSQCLFSSKLISMVLFGEKNVARCCSFKVLTFERFWVNFEIYLESCGYIELIVIYRAD